MKLTLILTYLILATSYTFGAKHPELLLTEVMDFKVDSDFEIKIKPFRCSFSNEEEGEILCFDPNSLDPIYTGHFSGKNFVVEGKRRRQENGCKARKDFIEGRLDFTKQKIVLTSFRRRRENYSHSSNCKDTIKNFSLVFGVRELNPGEKVLIDFEKSQSSGDHISDCKENLDEKIENLKKQEISVYDYCNFSPEPLSYKAGLKIVKDEGWGFYGPAPIYLCKISLHYYCEKI